MSLVLSATLLTIILWQTEVILSPSNSRVDLGYLFLLGLLLILILLLLLLIAHQHKACRYKYRTQWSVNSCNVASFRSQGVLQGDRIPSPTLIFKERCFPIYTLSQKTVQICFWQNFVKFPPNLINFGKKMANRLKLCKVHSFSTSPDLHHHITVLNADVPNCYTTL